jgi:hypothetical protein
MLQRHVDDTAQSGAMTVFGRRTAWNSHFPEEEEEEEGANLLHFVKKEHRQNLNQED